MFPPRAAWLTPIQGREEFASRLNKPTNLNTRYSFRLTNYGGASYGGDFLAKEEEDTTLKGWMEKGVVCVPLPSMERSPSIFTTAGIVRFAAQ